MPRRTSARTVTSPATPQAPAALQQLVTPYDANIHQLRHHWKWAAFSQFFFTFSPLLAMTDVTLADVENDLVHSTNRVLPRIMQRLLITLTQDRKITAESWQNALRRQYQRRDPEASPIGLLARSHLSVVESSPGSTAPPGPVFDVLLNEAECENKSPQNDSSATPSPDNFDNEVPAEISDDSHHLLASKEEGDEDEDEVSSETLEASEKQPDWLNLSMLAKLESLHTLAEWQFQNAHRVRQQMKTDDEQATWRIEPIGYDAKRNAYWLIGGDRLWIQREPPRLNLKRKRKPGAGSRNTIKKQFQSLTVKRQRSDLHLEAVGQSPAACSTRGKARLQLTSSPRGARAAKTRANQRLDMQARAIAEFRDQTTRSSASVVPTMPRKPTGTRVSARLRGITVEEDEWQEVPDEWLAISDTQRLGNDMPSCRSPASKKKMKTGLESEDSSSSELTELSDGEEGVMGAEQDSHERQVVDTDKTHLQTIADESRDYQNGKAKAADPLFVSPLPGDFVEWETICVTLEEWESVGHQFEKATHYAEKALHKVLSQGIVPMVTAELREADKKRQMEEAVVHRKRSSRIAMKEIEKEEERAAMRKRMEADEKMSRARRLEARQQREQAERLKRETAREQRRKEREFQERQSAESCEAEPKPDVDHTQEDTSSNLPPPQSARSVTLNAIPVNGTDSGSRSPAENWVLDCEVCGRKGVNQDDGVPLLCCGICGKWQHIVCHDKQDTVTGRLQHNWDIDDFFCRQCRLISSKSSISSLASSLPFGVKNSPTPGAQARRISSPNHLRSHSDSGYPPDSSSNASYHDRPDTRATVPIASTHSYPPQTHSAGVTFAHYQPQQGGFSTSRPSYAVQDVQPPQHAGYANTSHTASAKTTTYPSTVHVHERWFPSPYPRASNSYTLNDGSPRLAQGVHPYYNGHGHAPYSHIRGTTNSTVLGQYAGLQHVSPYQHNK